MATRDQLEIIGPGGQIWFHDLNPVKGFTNIGSHPDNDVVIPSPDVAPFHAVIDHRQRPAQIIIMGRGGPTKVGGQPVEANSSRALNNWDTIELNGHTIVLMEDMVGDTSTFVAPPASIPAAPTAATYTPQAFPTSVQPVIIPATRDAAPATTAVIDQSAPPVPPPTVSESYIPAFNESQFDLHAPVPDQTDEQILLEISAREFIVDVDQTATFDLTVVNGGSLVATFDLRIEGLDPLWVVSPPSVNLLEGNRSTLTVNITPPRKPTSRAGIHYFAVIVTSPELPGHRSQIGCTLTINPYYEHTVTELSPRQQRLNWFKRAGKVNYVVGNRGNSEAAFRLDAADDERVMQFEFKLDKQGASLAKQAELKLHPEEIRTVDVGFSTQKRVIYGLTNQMHSFTVTTTPIQGGLSPRSLLGQVDITPLLGPIHLIIALIVLAAIIVLIFRPTIQEFEADLAEIESGETVTLSWRASPFASVKIDNEVGAVERGEGSVQVMPLDNTTYRLTATNFLSMLVPQWFTATREITVIVDPIYPIVRFRVDRDQLITGDSATLSWDIRNADEVVLIANGALETIPKEQHTGSRAVTPTGEAVYTIQARNRYTTDPISRTIIINATDPTETPVPPPVINRFDAQPSTITQGEEVTLEWNVTSAEKVRIDPLGQEFPPIGKLVIKPDTSTTYILTAFNGTVENRSIREVTVNPAPTATPVPGTPIIDFFTGTPLEVAIGSTEANNIQLAWSVSGDVTDVELSGDTVGQISGLPHQGTYTVAAGGSDTKFLLTAFNGDLTASQTIEIKVVVPVPVISSLSPASTTNVGGSGFNITVSGANFVNGSTVRWNGSDRPTSFVSATTLIASITSADIAEAGQAEIAVFNPADAGGGESGTATFYINNPVPVLSSITPSDTEAGSGDVTLIASGSGFVPSSAIRWNGVDLQTTYNTSNTLTAVIPEAKFATAGTATVSVFNPSPAGGSSGAFTFIINNPVPVLTSLGPPSYINVGSDTFTLTINGEGFVSGAKGTKVSWDGIIRTANYVSDTQLQLIVPAADIAVPGTVEIATINSVPGGGPSNTLNFEIRKAPVNITLNGSPPSGVGVAGQSLTFSAVVTPSGATPYTPTGTITFKYGSTELGNATLSGNPATASITGVYFPAGSFDIVAVYSGDGNYETKTSAALNYVVAKANVTIEVSASPNPGTLGAAITLNGLVKRASPSVDPSLFPSGGTLQFYVNGSPIGAPQTVNSGGAASFVSGTTDFSGGTSAITASYDGTNDLSFNSASPSSPIALSIEEIQPTVSVSAPTVTYGNNSVLTATISSPVAGYSPQDGAVVTFKNGSTVLGTTTMSGGVATYTVFGKTFGAGTYTINVDYSGASDPNFKNASGSTSHAVGEASTSTIVTANNPSTSTYGSTVNFSASVSSSVGTPTSGTITFYYDGSTPICTTGTVSGGLASCASNTIPGGIRTITARYNGEDANYQESTSGGVEQKIDRLALSPSYFTFTGTSGAVNTSGGTVTGSWTVTVTNPSGLAPITGTITFNYQSTYPNNRCGAFLSYQSNPTVTISGGSATKTEPITQSEGYFQIMASYNGDTNYAPVSSVVPPIIIGVDTPCS